MNVHSCRNDMQWYSWAGSMNFPLGYYVFITVIIDQFRVETMPGTIWDRAANESHERVTDLLSANLPKLWPIFFLFSFSLPRTSCKYHGKELNLICMNDCASLKVKPLMTCDWKWYKLKFTNHEKQTVNFRFCYCSHVVRKSSFFIHYIQ